MSTLDQFDSWFDELSGPAALVIREFLMPVEGRDGVLFPATFAASEDGKFKGGYNIDEFPGRKNICLVDSVGSQANRIEPLFARKEYADLVPQIVIKAGTEHQVNLLEAGHRAGDAIVRCSALQQELQQAFKAVLRGDAAPLAALAPTSLVFGVWDSRDTQAKLPRLITSTIRAYDVRPLTRSAQYVPAIDYVENGLLEASEDKAVKDSYAKQGFAHVPASSSHGGIIADGDVRREATLQLAALRLLRAGQNEQRTLALRRYVLGLALTAFTAPASGYLRQGCNLVQDPDRLRECVLVYPDGRRLPLEVTHAAALEFTRVAAQAFGIGKDQVVPFETSRAQQELGEAKGKGKAKAKGKGKAGKKDGEAPQPEESAAKN